MGNYRLFLTPTGLIRPDELPSRWGLLELNARGHLKPIAGAALALKAANTRLDEALAPWMVESDRDNELGLIVRLFNRVGDVEASNRLLRSVTADRDRLAKRVQTLLHRASRRSDESQ